MNFLDKLTYLFKYIFETGFKESAIWKEYLLGSTISHCNVCVARNDKIYHKEDLEHLPEHPNCLGESNEKIYYFAR